MTTRQYRQFGATIKDSRNHLSVYVKPEDIIGAVCRDHQRCVIARAIKRQIGAAWVDVGADTVLIGDTKTTARRYKLPKLAKLQVRWFDTHDGAFSPCRVDLAPPPPTQAIGYRKGPKADSGPSTPRAKRNKNHKPTR